MRIFTFKAPVDLVYRLSLCGDRSVLLRAALDEMMAAFDVDTLVEGVESVMNLWPARRMVVSVRVEDDVAKWIEAFGNKSSVLRAALAVALCRCMPEGSEELCEVVRRARRFKLVRLLS